MTGQLLGGGITNEAAIALCLIIREEADRHRFGLCRCHGFGGTLAEQLARALARLSLCIDIGV